MVEMVRMASPRVRGNEIRYVVEALESGWLSSQGNYVTHFEHQFARWVGSRYALAVSSGTTALHLAVASAGIGVGDEVIVPALSMAAPLFAVTYCGARPVPVDIGADWNINPELIAGHITERTRAIMVVHNYGWPCQMDVIADVAREHGLVVIEDAAEAMGAQWNGKMVGTLGASGCYSLYANKVITTGEGGVVVTDDARLYERMKDSRSMNFGPTPATRFIHDSVGFSYRMSNIQAAIACGQLEQIDICLNKRRENGVCYDRMFANVKGVITPSYRDCATCMYWVYPIMFAEESIVHRVQQMLEEHGIESRRFFGSISQQPFMAQFAPHDKCPVADDAWARGLLLPIHSDLCQDDVIRVVEAVKRCLEVLSNAKS